MRGRRARRCASGWRGSGPSARPRCPCAVAVAAIVFLTRPDDGRTAADTPITSSTTSMPDDTVADDVPTADAPAAIETSEFGNVSAWVPQDGLLVSPVPATFGWFAMQGPRSGGRLVRSTDGLNWTRSSRTRRGCAAANRPRRRRHVLLVNGEDTADGWSVDRWRSIDGVEWAIEDTGAFTGDGQQFGVFGANGVTLVLSEAESTEPVPRSAPCWDFVAPDIADATCAIDQEQLFNFRFFDCAGAEILLLSDVPSSQEDRLSFAGQVLAFRYTVHVSVDRGPADPVLIPPATSLVGITPAENGFVVLVFDASAAIDDPVLAITSALQSAEMRRYEIGVGFRSLESAPIEGQPFRDQLLPGPDGRIYLSQTDGVQVAAPALRRLGARRRRAERRHPTRPEIRVLQHRSFTYTELTEGRIWLSREGEVWVRVDKTDGLVFEAVLDKDDYVVFRDFRSTRNELIRRTHGRSQLGMTSETDTRSSVRIELDDGGSVDAPAPAPLDPPAAHSRSLSSHSWSRPLQGRRSTHQR